EANKHRLRWTLDAHWIQSLKAFFVSLKVCLFRHNQAKLCCFYFHLSHCEGVAVAECTDHLPNMDQYDIVGMETRAMKKFKEFWRMFDSSCQRFPKPDDEYSRLLHD